ncbi:ESX-1 secretion-associated protein [Planosporangium thailandense]|uniref:ESX-1 secretion-associated protein n=1 Tax=Planosporangium thailandense TaxID=765197 RepID=A0ABX0Y0E2_9ACTN|nr:type VII secretion target [Planosporangium thailandense]NJC71632.1 ESX-1 secretion-associated protein [Planosporangium thailandense]
MPSADGTDVTPAELVAHAGHIETIAGQVSTARQAGDAVRLDAGAYGKLCTIVPALLGGLQNLLVDGIDTAARSLHDTGARLRTAAESYQAADASAEARHQQVWGPQ